MATALKNGRSLLNPTSNVAGSTTFSTVWNLTTALGGIVQGRVVNGATAPTLGCEMIVQISTDMTSWRELTRQAAGVVANGIYDFVVDLPAAVISARVGFSGNTVQAVTVEAFGHELTSVG